MTTKPPPPRHPEPAPIDIIAPYPARQVPWGGPPAGFPDKGDPLPDGFSQEPLFSEMMHIAHTRFDGRNDVLVSGDTFIYYRDPAGRGRGIAPDFYISFGADIAQYADRYGYSIEEVGKAPDLVMEVASPSTYERDLGFKRELYAWLGIGEYWLLDRTGGDFYGAQLAWAILDSGEYRPRPVHHEPDGEVWAYSPTLELSICSRGDWLRFYDPEIPAYLRSLPQAERLIETQRSSLRVAETRARAAETRAAAAEAEAQALREQLQRLRGQ